MATDTQHEWQSFASLADEFVITYSSINTFLVVPMMFQIGHALELYLKAALLKLDPNEDVKKYGHQVKKLVSRIREKNPNIFPALDLDKFDEKTQMDLIDSLGHTGTVIRIESNELYFVANYLADIKYLGTVHKDMPYGQPVLFQLRNPYWASVVKEIKDFLGEYSEDKIRWAIEGHIKVTDEQLGFLKKCIE